MTLQSSVSAVREGNLFNLNCSLRGYPKHNVTLKLNGNILKLPNVNHEIVDDQFEKMIILSFMNISRNYSGTYTCEDQTGLNKVSKNITVYGK